MIAHHNIRCSVVAVPVSPERGAWRRGAAARDLLPWADPYVAQLIKNLQDEVRRERLMRSIAAQPAAVAVAEPSTSWRISAAR
jgi:hypothetical protein